MPNMAAPWHPRTEREKVVNGTGTGYRKNSPRRLCIAILEAVVALPKSIKAILKNKNQYHWRELLQVSFLSRRKFCRDKHVFVATKVSLSRQKYVCRDKRVFVATKVLLVAAPASDKSTHKRVN